METGTETITYEEFQEIWAVFTPEERAEFDSLINTPSWIPHSPTERQRVFIDLDCEEAFYGGAAGGGKLLPLDTPIPTPNGWTAIGRLGAGDWVFSDKGIPCQVLDAFAPEIPKVSYRLTFDDGFQIDAGEEHKWLTFDVKELSALTRRDPEWRARRRARRESRATGIKSAAFTEAITARNKACPPVSLPIPTGSVRTTDQIYRSLYTAKGRANHAVPVAGALVLPNANLALDPYCLGAWLGDGSCDGGRFSGIDSEIWQQFEQKGFTVSHHRDPQSHGILGLSRSLREIGVLKRKHVPDAYLRASKVQRLALLQGLMDTDGTVCSSGSVEFTNTNKSLIDSVHELIVSLGWKARIVEGRATLDGKDCGPKWDIKWTPSEYVFRLSRKRDRQKLATRRTTRFRYIVDCRPIPSVPMRCISVNSPSHLYLAGRSMIPTHNSDALLMAALQYVDVPKYAAIIFRRTYTDLTLPEALMSRAREWLSKTKARWIDKEKTWLFPSGATLTFGYLETENDKYRYQGSAYQFVGFDELTQFTESQYTYLFSRLRRLAGSSIPIRMRSGSNPGGIGAQWVHERFIPEGFTPDNTSLVVEKKGVDDEGRPTTRTFVPSRLKDNPYLDADTYVSSLNKLDPVTRAQLLRGDWTIKERGNILGMWDENVHVISWSEFASVFDKHEIPTHWLLSIYQDWGTTVEHPCATTWFARAPANAPVVNGLKMAGQVFAYRGMLRTDCTVREVAEDIITAMKERGEKSRCRRWQMSHEASSERIAYNREHHLPFVTWETGRTRGIAQLRNALELVDMDKPHPFHEGVMGHPQLYFVVDDDEKDFPKTDAGLVRHRAEAPAYKWASLKSGEPVMSLVPYALFNDAMDTVRAAAADYWPSVLPLSQEEKNELALNPSIRAEAIEKLPQTEKEIAIHSRRVHLGTIEAKQKQGEKQGSRIALPKVRFRR